MKKIFYILDSNGEFYSTDRTKRYKQLTGQALYAYLRTEEGKKKYFDVWKDDDRDVMIGVEVPTERVKIYVAERRRSRYIKQVMKELDISLTSLDIITDVEMGLIGGEEILPDMSINIEDEITDKIQLEELHRALQELSKEEMLLIGALFFDGYSEREWSVISGIPQKTINNRKQRIIEKLKKILRN